MTDNIYYRLALGIIGDDKINCYKALEIGLSSMNRIIGGDFGSVKFHKKDKVLSLKAVNSSVKIDNEVVTIDPTLIFQRISLNIQSKTDMHKFLEYELAPYPLSLFDEGGMQKGRKSSFYDNFSKISGVSRGPNDFYVVGGGFLLHKVRWDTNKSIDFIIKQYVDYTTHNYSRNSTIVFDGYQEGINVKSTKAAERSRKENKNLGREIEFNRDTILTISQDKFLSRNKN